MLASAWSMREQEVLLETSASLLGSLLQRERPSPGDGLGGGWEREEEPGWGGHVEQAAVELHECSEERMAVGPVSGKE